MNNAATFTVVLLTSLPDTSMVQLFPVFPCGHGTTGMNPEVAFAGTLKENSTFPAVTDRKSTSTAAPDSFEHTTCTQSSKTPATAAESVVSTPVLVVT